MLLFQTYQNKKRVGAVYILQMLSRFKMGAPNYDPRVPLVIDEAELLFPAAVVTIEITKPLKLTLFYSNLGTYF